MLAAMLCFGAVVSAGIITPTKVSANVSPKHVGGAPYTFKTTGTISFNPVYCPAGTTNPAYCITITKGEACSGKVSLKVALGSDPLLADAGKTIKSTTGKVDASCNYSIKVKLPKSDSTAKKKFKGSAKGSSVKVKFSVKFLGNVVLNPASAKTATATAKLTQP
jgi:hypothetical protein